MAEKHLLAFCPVCGERYHKSALDSREHNCKGEAAAETKEPPL